MSDCAFSISSILQAHRRITSFVRHTPLIYSPYLSASTGAKVWLKAECWQPTGSFKVRGALNKVALLVEAQGAKLPGIVTASAGNHGLGVAYAARSLKLDAATVFVPGNAPRAKVEKMRHLGVNVHLVGSRYEDAHQRGEQFARDTGAIYVSAYDDVDVVGGQATIALEVLQDRPQTDLILVPVGGGGMIAGMAVAARALSPRCQVIGVQPEASPAALYSLRDGVAYDPYDHGPTIADGLAGGFGKVPLEIAGALIEQIVLASEWELRKAIFTLVDRHQLVVEASGAISIVPLLNQSVDVAGKRVVCVLSGGNIETTLLRDILIEFGG